MSRGLARLAVAALAASLLWAALSLFQQRFASGDVYPEYSSLRSDPMGAKLLFDSLALVPGFSVERNFQPLEFLPDGPATVVMLALDPDELGAGADIELESIERAAARGIRIVAALRASEGAKAPEAKALAEKWRVRISIEPKTHQLYFSQAEGWSELYREGAKALAVERSFGKGSVALFAGSDDFTNRQVVTGGRLRQPLLAMGPNTRIVFDEQHLGIAESGSVVALARRFHLMGLGFGLALCATLLVWRNSMDFPPPGRQHETGWHSGRTSHAGLITLLRRHIPPGRLAAACWREWLNTNRGRLAPAKLARAEAIANARGDKPLDALREIYSVLKSKGEL